MTLGTYRPAPEDYTPKRARGTSYRDDAEKPQREAAARLKQQAIEEGWGNNEGEDNA